MDKQNGKAEKTTEQLIIEAAVKEFGSKGFDGARTSAIAAEAGVTHAMLHYYFRTKEKLFEYIFKDKFKNIINLVIAPMIETNGDIRERIRKGVEAHFDFLYHNRELPVFFITTINSRPDLLRDAADEISEVIRERLNHFQEELDREHELGNITSIDAMTLLGDIASLNVSPFVIFPMINGLLGSNPQQVDLFLQSRKKENVEIILRRISNS